MLLLRGWDLGGVLLSSSSSKRGWKRGETISGTVHLFRRRNSRVSVSCSLSCPTFLCVGVGIDVIKEIAQNKVLIAAAVSAAIGQLSKPFTSALFYGKEFDFKAAFQAGGFPSTHSSAAVATATTLGLERGFSDAVFGLSLVYAVLIMYDAQGVRREVGNHAKTFNKLLLNNQVNSNSVASIDADDSTHSSGKSSSSSGNPGTRFFEGACSVGQKPANASVLIRSDDKLAQSKSMLISSDVPGEPERVSHGFLPLKESVGHTEIEVIAGAFLGFFVSLASYAVQ